MMKFALRRNLIYPLQLLIWKLIREAEIYLISKVFNFKNSLFYTPIMFLGELLAGIIFSSYVKSSLKKKKKEEHIDSYPIKLIQTDVDLIPLDSNKKISFLIFIAAFSDFVQFLLRTSFVKRFPKISATLSDRLSANIAVIGALLYVFALKIKIFKNHIFALIVTSACLVIIISSEFIFQEINIFMTYWEFVVVLLIIIVNQLFDNLLDTIEKYLFEYDFVDPFKILFFEGLFGFILCFFLFLTPNFLEDLGDVYKNNSAGNFTLFFFLLIIYIVLCGGKNIFRVITTKIYSPMARVFSDYFLNPFYLIFYFLVENDFKADTNIKIGFYFGINIFLSIVNCFCGLVFNELLILFCCGLERNTHHQVSLRAKSYIEMGIVEAPYN